jgi:hypothetical protein
MPTVLPDATLSPSGSYTVAPTTVESSPYYQSAPPPTVSPSLTPADQVPSLGKPIIIDRREITPQSSTFQAPALTPTNTGLQGIRPIVDPNPGLRWDNKAPATNLDDQTAAAPTRRRWEYSPVRLANFTQIEPVTPSSNETRMVRGELRIESRQTNPEPVNAAWKNLN